MKLTNCSVLALFLSFSAQSFAVTSDAPNLPNHLTCLDQNHDALPFENSQVIQWKTNTPDQTLKRALIEGTVTQVYNDHTGHSHFAINIDDQPTGDIEVIYNDEFGALPTIQTGMKVVACGDYITVGPHAHLPSPMGAIIHWVHYNPGNRDGGLHKDGFLIVNGIPYGSTAPKVK